MALQPRLEMSSWDAARMVEVAVDDQWMVPGRMSESTAVLGVQSRGRTKKMAGMTKKMTGTIRGRSSSA